jgi:DNA-binding CsgD family transcriptional regulator
MRVTAPVQVGPSPQGGGPAPFLNLRTYPNLVRAEGQPRAYITTRERETLLLAANGHTNRSIAHAMGLKEDTVKTRMIKVRKKLRAADRTHAVAIALAMGLLAPGDVAVPEGANRGYHGLD